MVDHRHDVRVTETAQPLGLPLESAPHRSIGGVRRGELLDRDRLARRPAAPVAHHAPSAAAQLAAQVVSRQGCRQRGADRAHRSAGTVDRGGTAPNLVGSRPQAGPRPSGRANYARPAMATSTVEDDVVSVSAAMRGDPTGFAALYRRHVGAVRMAIRDNVHDTEGVADAVQDTFAKAFSRLEALREPERFRPWLLQIARNTAIDHRRVRRRVEYDDYAETEQLRRRRHRARHPRRTDRPRRPRQRLRRRAVAPRLHGDHDDDAARVWVRRRSGPRSASRPARPRCCCTEPASDCVRRSCSSSASAPSTARAPRSPRCATENRRKVGAHVRACDVCQGAAEHELSLYQMPADAPADRQSP